MISPRNAWQHLEDHLPARSLLPIETVAYGVAAGRVLAGSVGATVDVPMADVSAMDGFALAGELRDGRAPVRGVAAAGRPADFALRPGEAARIMTGAVVPEGADRVVPVEQTGARVGGDGEEVTVHADTLAGAHIRRRGEVVAKGDLLMAAGSLLTAGAVSTLATHGVISVPVVAAPRVAVLTTGDELVPAEGTPGPGQLRDSNGPFLRAAGRALGLDFAALGTAVDDRQDLEARIRRGLDYDVLLLTGGVSMGDFDFVADVLAEVGCTTLFEKVAIQPGKPLVAAVHGDGAGRRWVFGLPGNPASVMVTFWLFVRPVLRRLLGHDDGLWHGALSATLAAELPGSKGRDRFLPAVVEVKDGAVLATPRPPVGSHDAGAYGRGNAIVRVPPNRPPTPAGGSCEVLLVD